MVASENEPAVRLAATLLISSHGRSDRGLVRSHNEDVFLDDPSNRLWAVADGMGGHAAGDVASHAVVKHLSQAVRPTQTLDYIDRIDDALSGANAELVAYARDRNLDVVGSTAVLLVDAGPCFMCAWVGDSRVYQLTGGVFRQLTEDHVQVRPSMHSTAMSAVDALKYAHSGALLRAVGAAQNLVVEWRAVIVAPHDVLLLCSDGVTKEMIDADIGAVLARAAPVKDLVDELVDTCLAHGGRDNITAVVVRIEG